MSAAFVPVFTEYIATRERDEARRLASGMFTALLIFTSGFVLAGILAAPYLVMAIAPGFRIDPAKFNSTVFMARLMFPYLLFISLAALTMGMLNSMRIFFAPALAPAILNVFIISMVIILTPLADPPVSAAAYGVLIGGLFQFLFQIPFLKKTGMTFRVRSFWSHPGVRKIVRLMGPVVAGLSVTQINLFVNTILASFLASGSVSYLYYGMRLIHFPLGILGIAVSTAILPSFATLSAQRDSRALHETLCFGLRMVLFITIPAMTGLIFLRFPLVNLLFQRGLFDFSATTGTAGAVLYYAVGLWSFACVRVITQAFYARQDTRTPMRAAVYSVTAGIGLSIALMPILKHQGLALATSLGSMINLSILFHHYHQQNGIRMGDIAPAALRSLAAAFPIAVVCALVSRYFSWQHSGDALFKSGIVAATVVGSVGVYFLLHRLMKSPELDFVLKQAQKKS